MKRLAASRPLLLVSVRSAEEAVRALDGGADLIDVKEPSAGSLGAAPAEVCRQVAESLGRRVPWTMACGELAQGFGRLCEHLAETWKILQPAGLVPVELPVAIKVGLAGCADRPWREELVALGDQLPAGVGQVAVIYADGEHVAAPDPAEVLQAVADIRAVAVLVDTCNKAADGVLGHRTVSELRNWQAVAEAAGSTFVVAGKVEPEQFPTLAAANADIIAVRSAVCSQGREGTVEAALVRRVRNAIRQLPEKALLVENRVLEKRF
jgi:uncharacterized protein (UPF0264 family)